MPFSVCVSRSDGSDVGGPSLAGTAVCRPHTARPLRLPTGAYCLYVYIRVHLSILIILICVYLIFIRRPYVCSTDDNYADLHKGLSRITPHQPRPSYHSSFPLNLVVWQLDDLAMRPLALLRKLQHLSLRNCNQLCTSIRLFVYNMYSGLNVCIVVYMCRYVLICVPPAYHTIHTEPYRTVCHDHAPTWSHAAVVLCVYVCAAADVGVVDAVGGEDLRSVDLTGCTSVKNFRDLVLLKVWTQSRLPK